MHPKKKINTSELLDSLPVVKVKLIQFPQQAIINN